MTTTTTAPPLALSPAVQAQIDALPEEQRLLVMGAMGRHFEKRAQEFAARPKLPTAPVISDRDLILMTMYPGRDTVSAPLEGVEKIELEAMLATRGGDKSGRLPVYNQSVTMLTLPEAAAKIGVSLSTARRLVRSRKLDAVRLFKTIRLRSDVVWAFTHRPDLAQGSILRVGSLYRTTSTIDDGFHGVPVDTVAKILRVHPQTLLRWERAERKRDVNMMPLHGHGASKVMMTAQLQTYRIPYTDDQVVRVRGYDLFGQSRATKRLVEDVLLRREEAVPADKVRRHHPVVDAATGQRMYLMTEAAAMLGISASGARKALMRAGIPLFLMGGQLRVLSDDLLRLVAERAAANNRRYRPNQPHLMYNADEDPHLVSLPDAAQKLGITVRTLRRWMAKKKIEGVIRTGKLWVRGSDLRAHIEAKAKQAVLDVQERAAARAAAHNGADLTGAHIKNFTDWMNYRYDEQQRAEIDMSAVLKTRAMAAAAAGCRPSVIEQLVREGLIPARRDGRDLIIREPDLIAAAMFSAKVARMCPKLGSTDTRQRREAIGEYLSFEQAAPVLKRPVSEIRRLVSEGELRGVRFGRVHRLHLSEVQGPALARFHENAPDYRKLRVRRQFDEMTVNETANELGVSERTVLRWVHHSVLVAAFATKAKARYVSGVGWQKVPVRTNRGCMMVDRRCVQSVRHLRQVRGLLPPDIIDVTHAQWDAGQLPELQPWQEFRLRELEAV